MATITDSDLQELKDLINGLDKKIDINQARIDERLNAIESNLSDLKKQTDKQDNRLWVLISGMFLALLGILTKFAFFPNP
jgi:hypothetical protein